MYGKPLATILQSNILYAKFYTANLEVDDK